MNLTNIDCVGQNELCKVVSPKNSETPKWDIEICKTGDYKEPGYIKSNNFTPNNRIGEPKVSADKEQNTNSSDIADNESHGANLHGELFCGTEKDLDLIDIDDLVLM